MKKSVLALAVLAASGAAMAQVTVGGALGFSFQKDRTTPKAVHGMQMTDGHINFTAVEDLGGGFSATAKSEMLLRGRDTAITARDASISLMTPVGLVTLGSLEAPNGVIGRGWAGAPVSLPTGFDGAVIGGSNNIDVIAFNTRLAGVVMGVSYSESGTKDVNDLADTFGGLGALTGGAAGNKVPGGPGGGSGPLQNVGFNASYDNGPLSVGFSISQDSLSIGGLADASAVALFKAGYDGRQSTVVSGSYDFGAAKVGAGLHTKTKGWASETVLGVSVPMGQITLGLIYAAKTDDSLSLGDGVTANSAGGTLGLAFANLITADVKGSAARTGVAVGLNYALSKSTAINASYGTYDVQAAKRGIANGVNAQREAAQVTNEYRVRLLKTF